MADRPVRLSGTSPFPAVLRFIVAGVLLLFTRGAGAEVEFSSSMNPVGSGARATGMGGAFIAIADDATAASWNPAGLVQLEKPEISAVYSYDRRSQSYRSATHAELTSALQEVDLHDLNYASAAFPFTFLNRNMILTLNYQRLYDMNKRVNTAYTNDWGDGDYTTEQVGFRQRGSLAAISPAFAVQLLPELSVGVTVNIWDDVFGTCSWESAWSRNYTGVTLGFPSRGSSEWHEKNTFSGLNANIGLLYTYNDAYRFGFVVKTPFRASVWREVSAAYRDELLISGSYQDFSQVTPPFPPEKVTFEMPMSYGFGFAWRQSDNLTLALDLYRTQWSDFVMVNGDGSRWNPVSGKPLEAGRPKDTTQVRIGGEYLHIGDRMTVPVRAGFVYDPEPGRTSLNDYFGITLGSGIAYDRFAFDVSYGFRWGNRVSGDISYENSNSTLDVTRHTVMTSLIYHF